MNIDASRVGTSGGTQEVPETESRGDFIYGMRFKKCSTEKLSLGRYPANLIMSHGSSEYFKQVTL